jgi:hypothetical protein
MSTPSPVASAVLYVVVATFVLMTVNVGVKVRAPSLPVDSLWFRSLGHLVFTMAVFGPTLGWRRLFRTRRPGIQLARSMLLLASTWCFLVALARETRPVGFTARR